MCFLCVSVVFLMFFVRFLCFSYVFRVSCAFLMLFLCFVRFAYVFSFRAPGPGSYVLFVFLILNAFLLWDSLGIP